MTPMIEAEDDSWSADLNSVRETCTSQLPYTSNCAFVEMQVL